MGIEPTRSEKKERIAPRFLNAATSEEKAFIKMVRDERLGVNLESGDFVQHEVMIFKEGYEYVVSKVIAASWFEKGSCAFMCETDFNALVKEAEEARDAAAEKEELEKQIAQREQEILRRQAIKELKKEGKIR